MVFGQQPVHVSELFVGHGHRASAAIPRIYRNLLIPRQLSMPRKWQFAAPR
jgi:hypothetical protein